jgi:flagellar protein FlaJ
MRIPFVPFPVKVAVKMSRSFLPISNKLIKLYPGLETQLAQSNIEIKTKDYLSIAVFSSFFWFFLIFLITFPFLVKVSLTMGIFSLAISTIFGFAVYLNIIYYPKLVIARRVRDIEKNLVFALRHMLIQIKSGVPVFNAFESVAYANYGLLSVEFNKLSKEVISGTPLTDALENLIYRNPSNILRRVLWQILNSIKAGVDVGNSLSILLQNISNEQLVEIRKYGAQLSPLALMYMMFAIIIPTLGLSLIVILSLFSGFSFNQAFFYLFLIVLSVFQFSFIGIIKSRRPRVEL